MAKRKHRGFIAYRTYSFKDKDPIIDKLRTLVEDSGRSYKAISLGTGVSTTAMYNWFHGDTKRPQYASANAVARYFRHEFRLVPLRPGEK